MGKLRKPISASLRWSVFSRDGFSCRYCGAQAGQEGIELHADHVISVADGGDSSFDNLVTACKKCNGGKGARSLSKAPTSSEVIGWLNEKSKTLREQASAMAAVIAARKELHQMAVNLKCSGYQVESVKMDKCEYDRVANLCREFGSDLVLEWYTSAANHNVAQENAVKYISGCARNHRDRIGMEESHA